MPAANPVKLLVYDPVATPSFVVELDVVGVVGETAQQTPLERRLPPPLFVTLPPPEAVVDVMDVTDDVVTVGAVILEYGIYEAMSAELLKTNLGYLPNLLERLTEPLTWQ